jgi:hypothetical protein
MMQAASVGATSSAMRRNHTKHNCSCPGCRSEREQSGDGERAASSSASSKASSTRRAARNGTLSTRPRPVQQRKRNLLIDEYDTPPSQVVPLQERTLSVHANTSPVQRDPEILAAVQYYFEVFAQSIHPGRDDSPESWKTASAQPSQLRVWNDPMWFCANVAFAESMKNQTLYANREKTAIIAKYQNKALADLQVRLNKDTDLDVLLWTILILICVDISFYNFDSWKAHGEGLDRIIRMHGGLESMNSNPYLKQKIIGTNIFWNNKQIAIAMSRETTTYPKHPFPPDICVAISKLPRELADLALEGCFNNNLLTLMADACSIETRLRDPENRKIEDLRRIKLLAYEIDELFRIEGLSQLEQLVIAALVDYCVTLDSDRGVHWLLVGSVRMRISHLWCRGVKYVKEHAKAFIWAASVLAACSETTAVTFKLASNVLSLCSEYHVLDKEHVLLTCRQFMWADFLSEKLESKFDFSTKPADRANSASTSSSPPPMSRAESQRSVTPATSVGSEAAVTT